MMNIRFRYLYRDASNFKKFGAVVFSNLGGLPVTAVEDSLREYLAPEGFFVTSQIKVPEVFLFNDYPLNPDDHCFHQFDSVEVTDDPATDRFGRSISEFVNEIKSESQGGWEVFDPLEPFAMEQRLAFKRMLPE